MNWYKMSPGFAVFAAVSFGFEALVAVSHAAILIDFYSL
jgi:hypothetical protein